MRVLWFCNTPSNYSETGSRYNGGGWVSSLEDAVSDRIDLGIVFITKTPQREPRGVYDKASWMRERQHGVVYYPVFNGADISRKDRIKTLFYGDHAQVFDLVQCYLQIIEDFEPDVIQIFGSEHSFGLVAGHVDIPVVLHIQGLMNPYYKAFLPKGISWNRWLTTPMKLSGVFHKFYTREKWKSACGRELKILATVENYLGRTEWDEAEVRRVNPECRYFHGGEILRREFYESEPHTSDPDALTLVTTISEPPYKGMDVVLKTARLLKKNKLDFVWNVYGDVDPAFFEKTTHIKVADSGITMKGVATADELAEALRNAAIYVHPSYIDNSPNSVCEAQMMGLPVIAANVGGVPSLIEDGKTGILVEAGDAMAFARAVGTLASDAGKRREIGAEARRTALVRHDRTRIVDDLLETYMTLMNDN